MKRYIKSSFSSDDADTYAFNDAYYLTTNDAIRKTAGTAYDFISKTQDMKSIDRTKFIEDVYNDADVEEAEYQLLEAIKRAVDARTR